MSVQGISRVDFCIFDTEEKVLASTFEDSQMFEGSVRSFVESQAESQVIQVDQFFKNFDEQHLEYICWWRETGEFYTIGKMAAFQYPESFWLPIRRFDKDNFI